MGAVKTDNWSPSGSQVPVGFLPSGTLGPLSAPGGRELDHNQFGGRRWAGDRHGAEDGPRCAPRSPPRAQAPGCSRIATGTRLHLISRGH